ncbi:MAG: DNA methyltransferase [bacterium]|nr:DNA methyltransferase [bacterium]
MTTPSLPNFSNRTLFHGDNLDFLRGLNSETVHLIATDPPFKKGRDFHATPTSLAGGSKFKDRWRWDEDVHEEWVDQIGDDWPGTWLVIEAARSAYGADMAAFLCWLGVRLMEMRRVLTSDGTIYLHIDHTAHAYVKALLDSIFGQQNFRNEIVWCYRGGGVPTKDFARKHDTLLRYSKSGDYTFHRQFVPYSEASTALVESRGGVSIDDKERDLERGAAMPDWWTDINSLQTWSPERTGYPTQKPLPLYERIIEASSNPGDTVLDPFCGCATTPIAAERLGREWVGMDLWDGAHEMVLSRLAKEGLAVPDNAGDQRLMTFGDVRLRTDAPTRTDDNETAAPVLRLRSPRPEEPWQKLTNSAMRSILAEAQSSRDGLVDCAGCGRSLEVEYTELDHIQPRAEGGDNFITNRVLICSPCNRRKSDRLTIRGLVRQNRSDGWLKNDMRAKDALSNATEAALEVRDYWHTEAVQQKIRPSGQLRL